MMLEITERLDSFSLIIIQVKRKIFKMPNGHGGRRKGAGASSNNQRHGPARRGPGNTKNFIDIWEKQSQMALLQMLSLQ